MRRLRDSLETQTKRYSSHSRENGSLFANELWVPAFLSVADLVEIPNLAQLVPSPSRERDRVRVLSAVLSIPPHSVSLSLEGERTILSVACSLSATVIFAGMT